jgi:hypothetical protein
MAEPPEAAPDAVIDTTTPTGVVGNPELALDITVPAVVDLSLDPGFDPESQLSAATAVGPVVLVSAPVRPAEYPFCDERQCRLTYCSFYPTLAILWIILHNSHPAAAQIVAYVGLGITVFHCCAPFLFHVLHRSNNSGPTTVMDEPAVAAPDAGTNTTIDPEMALDITVPAVGPVPVPVQPTVPHLSEDDVVLSGHIGCIFWGVYPILLILWIILHNTNPAAAQIVAYAGVGYIACHCLVVFCIGNCALPLVLGRRPAAAPSAG